MLTHKKTNVAMAEQPFLPSPTFRQEESPDIPCLPRLKLFGALSVLSITLLIFVGLLASSRTPRSVWSGHDLHHQQALPKTSNVTDNFDELVERMAADWPKRSTVKVYRNHAVASDVTSCSTVGNEILNANGSAADAVIASALCSGVVHPYSSGLGGGAFIIYYDRQSKTVFTVNARETAPLAATEDMFAETGNISHPISPVFGWHSVAVPGELAGMWALHQRFGRLPWADLFRPAIKLARNGVAVTETFGQIFAFNKKYLLHKRGDESMRAMLVDPLTGSTFVKGDIIHMPVLADTLETIANDPFGVREFYNGSIAEKLIQDIQDRGGILTKVDLQQYQLLVEQPITTVLANNLTLYGLRPPSGNAILHYILNILEGYHYDKPWEEMLDDEKVLFYHRLTEAMKFGFAQRTKLADPALVSGMNDLVELLLNKSTAEESRRKINDSWAFDDPEYYGGEAVVLNEGGTAHISAMDKDGNSVAYSTSINNIFGAYRISTSTGIMLNNHMDDFTTDAKKANIFGVPPSEANKIRPGKRPQSSMTPVLIVDGQGNARLVAGGSGGTRILTGILNILTRILFFRQDLKSALDAPRLHHQLFPAEAEYEKRFDEGHVEALRKKGHKMVRSEAPQVYPYSAVEVIYANVTDAKLYAVSDGRKGGLPDGA